MGAGAGHLILREPLHRQEASVDRFLCHNDALHEYTGTRSGGQIQLEGLYQNLYFLHAFWKRV